MTPVALSFAVLHASGRSGNLAIVLAATSLTLLAFLLLGGAVGDRLPRGPLLVAANLAAAASQGAVAVLLLTGHYQLWALIARKRPMAAPSRWPHRRCAESCRNWSPPRRCSRPTCC
jgi:MFS family permease